MTAGKSYSSFTLLDVTECPDYNGKGYLFRHDRTGFEVYFFSTPDKECFFSYNVFTPAFDNTGVFHILEHTVLTGSKRYPVRDPFMGIDRGSVNTFLNAMTGPDRTYFPAASPVKKDFDNIFNVYTDAVFDPLLRKESFMQEGIRRTKNGFEGVVYSEMGGDVSNHASVVFNTANRFLFDSGSTYTFESGGDPRDIPSLTYEKFIETYRKYYVPANMSLFLYGELDIIEKLEFLDSVYLSKREPGKRIERPLPPMKWDEPRFVRATSDAEEGEEGASITVSWVLGPSSDPMLGTVSSLVVDMLLGNPGCPLYKAIIDSSVGRDISDEGGINDSFESLTFSVGFTGAKEEDARKGEMVILESLRKIVDAGLDRTLLEASLRRMEFRLQEIKEGTPNGYRLFFSRIDKGWAFGRNPGSMLSTRSEIEFIRRKLEEDTGFFEHWIEDNLINNPHRLLSVVVMDENNIREKERIIEENLRKYSYDEDEEHFFLIAEEKEDSDEALDTLPRLTPEDIIVENRTIPRRNENGILVSTLPTNGIVYADFVFDTSDFTTDELEYVSLLVRMLTMTNVGSMTYSEFLTSLKFVTGAFSSLFESGTTCSGEEKDYILLRFKSLKEHYRESLELILKLLTEGDFSSPERVNATLRDIQSDYESSLAGQAHLFALSSASRTLSPALYVAEKTQGLSFWLWVVRLLSNDMSKTGEKIREVASRAFRKERLTFHVVCEEKDEKKILEATEAFISLLPSGGGKRKYLREIPDDGKETAYTFSTPVNYTALAFRTPVPPDRAISPLRMLFSIVSRSSLWSLEREKGGAYGSGASLDINENTAFFYTYRDPRLNDSVLDFYSAVRSETFTAGKLSDAKLRVLSREVKPAGPQSMGLTDLRRYLYGITDAMRWDMRDGMLSVTTEDLEKVREDALRLMEKGNLTVISSARTVRESSREFRKIKLPFTNK